MLAYSNGWQKLNRLLLAESLSMEKYLELLKNSAEERSKFINKITTCVTEFYRDIQQWKVLAEEIIPILFKEKSFLNVWSAGCATGEETYTLAIILSELGLLESSYVIGTDINEVYLEKARLGMYKFKNVSNLPPGILEKYFICTDNNYLIKPEIREKVQFELHDLLRDIAQEEMDIIICRNVVIHFSRDYLPQVYKLFYDSLNEGGILFVGGAESTALTRHDGLAKYAYGYLRKNSKGGLNAAR